MGGLGQGLGGFCGVMSVCVVSLDSLCRWQVQVSVYGVTRIPSHLRCTQCSILLHLIDICFLTCICLWQISQIQTYLRVVVGPGLVSTSPAFMRSIASHPSGPHGRLAQKTVIGPPLLVREVSTQCAQGLPDRCDSPTACRLCRLEPWGEVITPTNMTHNSRKAWKTIRKLSNDPTTSNPPCLVSANQVAHQLLVNAEAPCHPSRSVLYYPQQQKEITQWYALSAKKSTGNEWQY